MNPLLAPEPFGLELRAILKRLGIKHKDFAGRVQVTPEYFSNIVNGKFTELSGSLLAKIAQELGADFSRLLSNSTLQLGAAKSLEHVIFCELCGEYSEADQDRRADISAGLKLCFGEKRRNSVMKLLIEYDQTFRNGGEGQRESKTGTK